VERAKTAAGTGVPRCRGGKLVGKRGGCARRVRSGAWRTSCAAAWRRALAHRFTRRHLRVPR